MSKALDDNLCKAINYRLSNWRLFNLTLAMSFGRR